MRTKLAAFAGLFIAASVALSGQEPKETPARLVVHEWGTFTSVADGQGASLEWRPLAGPSDLPSFVHALGGRPAGLRHGAKCEACGHHACSYGTECRPDAQGRCNSCKGCVVGTVRMETPVLYFYSDRETTVSVKVDFPNGKITEWYPQAREVAAGIVWGGVRVMPGAAVPFPVEKAPSHYYPARETDAHPVRVCGRSSREHEKFLFYRGVGTFDLPLKVTLAGDKVTVRNLGSDQIDQVVLFENRDGKIGYRIHCYLKDEVTLDRPDDGHGIDSLTSDLRKILTGQNLFEREAQAMIKTWRDSWFEPGLRVFYVVPRRVTDAVLPLELDPKPAELVRVLVGRVEILTPEMEREIATHARGLGSDSIEAREASMKALERYGRFAEPILKRLLESTSDPEVRVRIRTLLGG